MPLDKSDLLREAGYSEGDFIPLYSYHSGVKSATSSSSYSTVAVPDLRIRLRYSDSFPDNVTPAGFIQGALQPGGDQVDVRFRNVLAGETIVEETGTTGTGSQVITTIGSEYPAPSSEDILAQLQARNADNSTTVNVLRMTIGFGVLLD